MKFYISTVPVMITKKPFFGKPYRVLENIAVSIVCENGFSHLSLNKDVFKYINPEKKAEILAHYPMAVGGLYWCSKLAMAMNINCFLGSNSCWHKIELYGYSSAGDEVIVNELLTTIGTTSEVSVIDLAAVEIGVFEAMGIDYIKESTAFNLGFPATNVIDLADKMRVFQSHEDYPAKDFTSTEFMKRTKWIMEVHKFLLERANEIKPSVWEED